MSQAEGPVRVRIFYPADPVGVVPGGVDTFLRGLLKFAPPELEFSLVGMTTDPVARPSGKWTTCPLGERGFDFFPVVKVANAGQRSRLPLSVRYTAGVAQSLPRLSRGFDVFEFHRVEPALLFLADNRPKNAFFHQDMAVIRSAKADILWRYLPRLYFGIEKRVVLGLSSAWCVRQAGVEALQRRFPRKASVIRFVPTWVDTEVFSPVQGPVREHLRCAIAERYGLSLASPWVVSVGRLDSQKDPLLLLDAVARLVQRGVDVTWLVVGDGTLRTTLEQAVERARLQARVRFLGLMSATDIAEVLRAADVFALSSAYEGMPMAVLEALGSGLPVATTDVGEVRRVVHPGLNGAIADRRDPEAFAACLGEVIAGAERLRGTPAVAAIQEYRPAQVLLPVYENYCEIAGRRLHMRLRGKSND